MEKVAFIMEKVAFIMEKVAFRACEPNNGADWWVPTLYYICLHNKQQHTTYQRVSFIIYSQFFYIRTIGA